MKLNISLTVYLVGAATAFLYTSVDLEEQASEEDIEQVKNMFEESIDYHLQAKKYLRMGNFSVDCSQVQAATWSVSVDSDE